MLTTIHTVYCSGPSQPGGTTSGQRLAPSFFVKSMRRPLPVKSIPVICAVIGQFATSAAEPPVITAECRSRPSDGPDGAGGGGGGGGVGSGVGGACGCGRRSTSVPCTGPRHVVPEYRRVNGFALSPLLALAPVF